MKDLISVIVPAYNAEKYIEKCINSILNQTYKDIEVLVIDDGSKDDTYKILCEIKKSDKRLKVYKQKNAGVSSARNYGMKMATGKYIGFVDSDDYITPNMYEVMINNMDDDTDLILCNILERYEDEIRESRYIEKGEYNGDSIIKAIFNESIGAYVFSGLFRRKIISEKNLAFPNIKLSEDLIFLIEYLLNVKKITVIQEKCYVYNKANEYSAVSNLGNSKYLIDYIEYPSMLHELLEKYNVQEIYGAYFVKESCVVAMRIRLLDQYNYKEFKKVCNSKKFREGLHKEYINMISNKKYKLYYWALCNEQYWLCDLGYWFNYIKSRL